MSCEDQIEKRKVSFHFIDRVFSYHDWIRINVYIYRLVVLANRLIVCVMSAFLSLIRHIN